MLRPDDALASPAASDLDQPVRPGGLYELRFLLVDSGLSEMASSQAACMVTFHDGRRALSERHAFPAEVFSAAALQAAGRAHLTGSRFFRAPARADTARIVVTGLRESAAIALLSLDQLALDAKDMRSIQDPVAAIAQSRETKLDAIGAMTAELRELLRLPEAQAVALRDTLRLAGRWSPAMLALPSHQVELAAFEARVRPGVAKRGIAVIGSERLALHLAGSFWPLVPARSAPMDILDADPVAVVIEPTTDAAAAEWTFDLFAPDGAPSEEAAAFLRSVSKAGIPVILLCNDLVQADWGMRRLLGHCDMVVGDERAMQELAGEQGPAKEPRRIPLPPLVDARLTAPLREGREGGFRLLYPAGSDLYRFADVLASVQRVQGPHLLITEFTYRFTPARVRELPRLQACEIANCHSYLHACQLMRNASAVLLFEQSLVTPGMQATTIADAISSGAAVLYRGDASRLGPSADLVIQAESDTRLQEILWSLTDPVFREQEWLRRYRLLSERRGLDAFSALVTGTPGAAAPLASVICVSRRPRQAANVLANFDRQRHSHKELILLLNTNEPIDAIVEATSGRTDIRAHRVPEAFNIGYCLNLGRRMALGNYWFKMDDDDFYGPHYIGDMLAAFHWSGADAVGKPQALVHLEGRDEVMLREAFARYRSWLRVDENLCGATLSGRSDAALPHFSLRTRNGNDSEWVRHAAAEGRRLLFSDFLSFVVRRTHGGADHTWKIADADLAQRASSLGRGPAACGELDESFYEWA